MCQDFSPLPVLLIDGTPSIAGEVYALLGCEPNHGRQVGSDGDRPRSDEDSQTAELPAIQTVVGLRAGVSAVIHASRSGRPYPLVVVNPNAEGNTRLVSRAIGLWRKHDGPLLAIFGEHAQWPWKELTATLGESPRWLFIPRTLERRCARQLMTALVACTRSEVEQQRLMILPQGSHAGSLRRSEQKFLEVFHASSEAIFLMDGLEFIDCNEAAVNLFGLPGRNELAGMHPAMVSADMQIGGRSSFDLANDMVAAAFRKGYHRFRWLHRRASGEVFPAEVVLIPVPFQGKRLVFSIVQDLSGALPSEPGLEQEGWTSTLDVSGCQPNGREDDKWALTLRGTLQEVFGAAVGGINAAANGQSESLRHYFEQIATSVQAALNVIDDVVQPSARSIEGLTTEGNGIASVVSTDDPTPETTTTETPSLPSAY